jgi:O-glycosyl hydrolase
LANDPIDHFCKQRIIIMSGRAVATERTPLTTTTAAAAETAAESGRPERKRDGQQQQQQQPHQHHHHHHHHPLLVLLGSIVGLGGIVLLMVVLIGGASYEVWKVMSITPSRPQTIIVVDNQSAGPKKASAAEASSTSSAAMYRTGCRYYKTTTKAAAPPRILQTSMGQAGSPWSWSDCEDASSSSTVELNTAKAPDAILRVNFGTTTSTSTTSTSTQPTILGFGGAFTEAAALNYQRLDNAGRAAVLELLFGQTGLGYSMGRIPIHSCDFSVASYNFDSVDDDIHLDYFDDSVQHDVENGMIPFIQAAMATYQASYPNETMTLFGSPWSPPPWMKRPTQYDPSGLGHASEMTHSAEPTCLRGELREDGSVYAAAWAHYMAKWITAYGNHNIPIHAVTVQNEPEFPAPWEACAYSAANMTDFVAYHLGPRLLLQHQQQQQSNTTSSSPPIPPTQIWAFDHNKDHVNAWMQVMLNGTGHSETSSSAIARNYVKGTGYHWYAGGTYYIYVYNKTKNNVEKWSTKNVDFVFFF